MIRPLPRVPGARPLAYISIRQKDLVLEGEIAQPSSSLAGEAILALSDGEGRARALVNGSNGASRNMWRMGLVTTRGTGTVTSRNGPCPCGSGRKYKQCCLTARPAGTLLDDRRGTRPNPAVQPARLPEPAVAAPMKGSGDELRQLGVAAMRGGDLERAVELITRAIEIDPTMPGYFQDLTNAIQCMGDLTIASAMCLQRLWPDDGQVQQLVADALARGGDYRAALDAYQAILQQRPSDGPALQALAFVLGELGDNGEAEVAYREAIASDPNNAALHHNLGDCLRQLGRLDEACSALEEAVRLSPEAPKSLMNLAHLQQMLCRWQGLEDRWARIRTLLNAAPGSAINPFFFLNVPATAAEQLRCAQNWTEEHYGALKTGISAQRIARLHRRHERLHIGYISSDFREHPLSRTMAEVFELHDRSDLTISAYSIGPDDHSALRARVVHSMDRFVELFGASRAVAAEQIETDGVDILVDLNGHTTMNRADILALRPAPIQVSFWGFPGSTGASFIDYAIVDPYVVPVSEQACYSERLAYMPNCYMPIDSTRQVSSDGVTRAACGLPDEGFVFCAFNNVVKITPAMFAVWMRVLDATPGSILWLLETNRWAPECLSGEAERAGINPRRLVFAPALPPQQHLARHTVANLFLDTLPYNGHTTTSDALWSGLPVLTCTGETFASRVAGSALRAAGLPGLVTNSLAEYEAQAIALARDPARLNGLRSQLWANRETAPLFDCRRFTRDLETLYRRMWDDYAR